MGMGTIQEQDGEDGVDVNSVVELHAGMCGVFFVDIFSSSVLLSFFFLVFSPIAILRLLFIISSLLAATAATTTTTRPYNSNKYSLFDPPPRSH